jgi:DNA-binding transcriptional ArsR family regulator
VSDEFKALSDPNRRQILRVLGSGELNVGQIGEHLAISAATLSHHLTILKKADLIRMRREGTTLIYSLNTTVIQDVVATILDFLPDPQIQGQHES